jgi:hypothetical protein
MEYDGLFAAYSCKTLMQLLKKYIFYKLYNFITFRREKLLVNFLLSACLKSILCV